MNTSRLVHQKAFDDIIRALAKLPPNIKLLAVGRRGRRGDAQKLADELGVSDRVIFTGQVDRGVVTLYRRAADILLHRVAQRDSAMPLFLLASRLPLIATQVGGMADYVFDEKHNPIHIPPHG